MPKILGIDPGTTESAYVAYDAATEEVIEHGHVPNEELLSYIRRHTGGGTYDAYAIEMIASYGMAVGKTTFDTVLWIGRMVEIVNAAREHCSVPGCLVKPPVWRLCFRKQITKLLCYGAGSGDKEIKIALKDRFPATGGGKNPVVGTKGQPGPLYGISKHKWSALAVAVYAAETPGTLNAIPETVKG